MDIIKIYDENYFDPTPRLKSSPIPILFVSFNKNDEECIYCGGRYITAILCQQKYCIKCLSCYITDINDNNIYLDLYLYTKNLECNCQKYCTNCLIFYTGCRYCLTTNVIFGPTIQSQCKKCKRVSSINFDINNISVGNNYLDDLLSNLRLDIHNNLKITEFADKVKGIDKYFEPYDICDSIYKDVKLSMEWIPYSQFTNIKEIAKGGFGIIYQADWLDGSSYINKYRDKVDRYRSKNETVILKRFINSKDIDKHFLNELKSNQYCYQIKHHIVKTYGFTKDPELDDYILVMQYAKGGDLHNWLQRNFTRITWNKKKLAILWQISEGLETIHKAEFIHRDFHSGNILSSLIDERRYFGKRNQWQIGDLGLSQPANKPSLNNEIYGVIPYIAPEIFKGSAFSKESDVYCVGMIMWELTTGCKPFANVEHDIQLVYKILDGERPEITEDTPECYANLMKSCWDSDPEKRPTITEIRKTFGKWFFKNKHIEPFNQAEIKRIELINLKKLGPESSEKPHPNAIFTSRPLSFFISKCSSINSSKDYTSLELELDIDIERSKVLGTKRNIEKLNISSHENNGKHIKLYNNI
ncbi:kinase-like domain-containing protein [Rhizophagus irregularis DAOM 181602=DAOM 197198]|nr:kinase-like domain-containing protein [Rhizophagus irregularis DAOM 181602=DAOM 197198]